MIMLFSKNSNVYNKNSIFIDKNSENILLVAMLVMLKEIYNNYGNNI